jgi:heterotetrameric sarcosine oxidase gamma subunit
VANLSVSWRVASVTHVTRKRGAPAPDLGCAWPDINRATDGAAFVLANIAPDTALAIAETADSDLARTLPNIRDAIVVDQSGAYRILRLAGPAARDILASGVFIDLDSAEFPIGAVAALRCGHIAIIMLNRGGDTFDILVPRSYAESFLHWLKASAAMRKLPPIEI